MRITITAVLIAGNAFLPGCTIFKPYISQPKEYGTFQAASNGLQKLQDDLDSAVTQQRIIGSVSGFGTFIGFGAAGISAIFRASYGVILGLGSLGATSYTFNGLYGNRAQTAIYLAGLDAVACINDAVAPLTTHVTALKLAMKTVQDGETSVRSRLAEVRDLITPTQRSNATSVLDNAADTERLIEQQIAKADINSSKITSAIRSVVATVNKQLTTVVPDATALARAGSSLGGQIMGVSAGNIKSAHLRKLHRSNCNG